MDEIDPLKKVENDAFKITEVEKPVPFI